MIHWFCHVTFFGKHEEAETLLEQVKDRVDAFERDKINRMCEEIKSHVCRGQLDTRPLFLPSPCILRARSFTADKGVLKMQLWCPKTQIITMLTHSLPLTCMHQFPCIFIYFPIYI